MKKYKLSNVAEKDILRIYLYGMATFGPHQADIYFDSLFSCFEKIAAYPYAFESVDYIKNGYRRCVCGSDSIYFRIVDNFVEIMTIIGRQNIDSSF